MWQYVSSICVNVYLYVLLCVRVNVCVCGPSIVSVNKPVQESHGLSQSHVSNLPSLTISQSHNQQHIPTDLVKI